MEGTLIQFEDEVVTVLRFVAMVYAMSERLCYYGENMYEDDVIWEEAEEWETAVNRPWDKGRTWEEFENWRERVHEWMKHCHERGF